MAKRICLIDLPGLSRDLLPFIPADTALGGWLAQQQVADLIPTFPAVTCSVQASLTTGVTPATHGIIANGLPTFRFPQDQAKVDASNFATFRRQISFWEQSNQLVEARRFWQDEQGQSLYKTALLFFQQSMPGFASPLKPAADIVLTPKPDHGPDGKLVSLCWSEPRELVPELFQALGPFPLMQYWGPLAGIASSQWIAKAAAAVWQHHRPQLQLTYVPHLDYDLQRFGPDSPQAHQAVADVARAIEPLVQAVLADEAMLVVLSEYAIETVSHSAQPNQILRDANLLFTRATADGELIDYERSEAFAMVDHQIAHVYTSSPSATAEARAVLEDHALIEVHTPAELQLNHRRSGDLILSAVKGAWLDYRWWESAGQAPAFARTADIHRKPGYDPLELFFDPATRSIIQDATRIRGSHGRVGGPNGILAGIGGSGEVKTEGVGGLLTQALATRES